MIQGKKVHIDSYEFDSMAEAGRYQELKLMLAQGRIKDLKVHPLWILIHEPRPLPEQVIRTVYKGKKITNKLTFEADFVYTETDTGKEIVEDVKAKITKANRKYVLKEAWLVRFKMWCDQYSDFSEFRIIQR